MKKQKKLLVMGLVFAFFLLILGGTANAGWMSSATIKSIVSTNTGNYTVEAETAGGWNKIFTIQTSAANANALLAIALTAGSGGNLVTIEYDGSGNILRLKCVTP